MNSRNSELPLEISCRDLEQRFQGDGACVLLDCRESIEVETVKIAGSLWIPMSELENRLSELEPYRDGELVVYCHVGGRSLTVARWLREREFPRVQSMSGGIDRWAAEIDQTLPRY